MTGRRRGFFSREKRIAALKTDRATAEAALFEATRQVREAREGEAKARRQRDAHAVEVDQLRARLAGVEAERDVYNSVIDLVRQALAGSAYFAGSAPDDVVAGVERIASAHRDLAAHLDRLRGERDRVKQRADDRVLELDKLRLSADAYRTAPTDQAAQDRRNAVLLCDALALSEARHGGQHMPPLADEKAATRLLKVVRAAVSAHLGADLERVS